MEKAEEQSNGDSDGGIRGQRKHANADVMQAQTKVEANLAQLPDGKKTVDACIQQQHFIEDGKTRAPCRLEPA